MFLYSKTIEVFLNRIKQYARDILINEMSLDFKSTRILFNGIYYPLNFLCFEDQSRLGHFDYRTYEIGINKKLMYMATQETLKNVLRHELAHYYTYLLHGNVKSHGDIFHSTCLKFNWGKEVYAAYGTLEVMNEKENTENEKIKKLKEKLEKLMALTKSSNIHESELAMMKANQLILEHNLNEKEFDSEETVFVKRVLESKRKNAKHVAIYDILKTFYVAPVFNHGKDIFYLEVVGDQDAVIVADYVANFLNHELEILWKNEQALNPKLKGKVAKNSFFKGMAKGHIEKIELQKTNVTSSKDLILIKNELQKKLHLVYPKLSHSYSKSNQINKDALNSGLKAGKNLNIRPGIKDKVSKILFLS